MADVKISGLPASTTPLAGTEVLPIVQGGITKQVSVTNLTTGKYVPANGMVFPATAVLSANANTLDDYEEGTWTPVLGSDAGESGQTYTEQNGFYQKIGSRVYFQFRVQLSAKGSVNLEASLKGLPFNVSFVVAFGCGTVTDFRNLELSYTSLGLMPDANNPKMYFRALTAAATSTGFAQANSLYTDTTLIQGFGSYVTSA
jgi:hypothetical protein